MKKILLSTLLALSLHASQFAYIYVPETNSCIKADENTTMNIASDILHNRAYISAYMPTEIGDVTITSIDYNGDTFDLRTFSTIESCTLFTDMVREKFN